MKKMTKWLVAGVIVLAAGVTSVSAFAASDNFNRPNHRNEQRIHQNWKENCQEHLGTGMFTQEEIIQWEKQREERRAENRQQRTASESTRQENRTEWKKQREEGQAGNRQEAIDIATPAPEQDVIDETEDWEYSEEDYYRYCDYRDGDGTHRMGNGMGRGMHKGGGNGQGMGRHHNHR